MDIITLLQSVNHLHHKTTWRQLVIIAQAMLAMTGRVTMLGLSRWTEPGGSYRTIQRFFQTTILWPQINLSLFLAHRYQVGDEVAMAGDQTVVTKSGNETYGLGYFFSSMAGRAVKGLEFFSLSFVNLRSRESSPIFMKQTLREKEKKAKPKRSKHKDKPLKKSVVARKGLKTKISARLNYHLT